MVGDWSKSNQKARTYILAGMSYVMTTQFEHFKIATNIINAVRRFSRRTCSGVLLT